MRTRSGIVALLVWLAFAAPAGAADLDSIGDINFPLSSSPAASAHFTRGLAFLHNFSFKQARAEFRQARTLEPDFAMAYWGEAMSFNHPLLPEQDAESPARVLLNLGADHDARLGKASTALEKNFISAAEAYALTPGDGQARREAFLDAMEQMYLANPRHQEVRAFYALALLSAAVGESADIRAPRLALAAQISGALLEQNPRHPGAAHYLVHSLEQPEQAGAALEAAVRYAGIAPLLAHARHMPAHAYIYLGNWAEVAALNEAAFYVDMASWASGDSPVELNHFLEWGQYGDLQLANYDNANEWIQRAEETLALNPADVLSQTTLARLRARFMVETQQWQPGIVAAASTTDELLATGLSAIAMRDMALAGAANQELKQRAAREPEEPMLQLSSIALDGSILFAAGEEQSGREVFSRGLAIESRAGSDDAIPDLIKPITELYGETLLRSGHYREAHEQFSRALERHPHRPLAVLGLARSLVELGRPLEANSYYQFLLDTWGERNFVVASEAKTHLSIYGDVGDDEPLRLLKSGISP